MAGALLLAGSALSWLALLARYGWFLELFSHFRMQYLALQAVGVGFFLLRRRWWPAAVCAVLATPHLMAVAPYLPGLVRSPAVGAAPELRLVALNLQYTNDDFPRALAYLLDTDADVLVLSEFTPRAQQRLAALADRYPHRVYRPQWDAWGLAVYSRLPVHTLTDLDLDGGRSVQLHLRFASADQFVDVYAVHLASPTRPDRAALRDGQLGRLAAELRARAAAEPEVPRLVVGDLNLTPFSPRFAALLAGAGLADARKPFGLHVTWPMWPVPLWIPIDHCLVAGPVDIAAVRAGPAVGSDHRPLEIRFGIRSGDRTDVKPELRSDLHPDHQNREAAS